MRTERKNIVIFLFHLFNNNKIELFKVIIYSFYISIIFSFILILPLIQTDSTKEVYKNIHSPDIISITDFYDNSLVPDLSPLFNLNYSNSNDIINKSLSHFSTISEIETDYTYFLISVNAFPFYRGKDNYELNSSFVLRSAKIIVVSDLQFQYLKESYYQGNKTISSILITDAEKPYYLQENKTINIVGTNKNVSINIDLEIRKTMVSFSTNNYLLDSNYELNPYSLQAGARAGIILPESFFFDFLKEVGNLPTSAIAIESHLYLNFTKINFLENSGKNEHIFSLMQELELEIQHFPDELDSRAQYNYQSFSFINVKYNSISFFITSINILYLVLMIIFIIIGIYFMIDGISLMNTGKFKELQQYMMFKGFSIQIILLLHLLFLIIPVIIGIVLKDSLLFIYQFLGIKWDLQNFLILDVGVFFLFMFIFAINRQKIFPQFLIQDYESNEFEEKKEKKELFWFLLLFIFPFFLIIYNNPFFLLNQFTSIGLADIGLEPFLTSPIFLLCSIIPLFLCIFVIREINPVMKFIFRIQKIFLRKTNDLFTIYFIRSLFRFKKSKSLNIWLILIITLIFTNFFLIHFQYSNLSHSQNIAIGSDISIEKSFNSVLQVEEVKDDILNTMKPEHPNLIKISAYWRFYAILSWKSYSYGIEILLLDFNQLELFQQYSGVKFNLQTNLTNNPSLIAFNKIPGLPLNSINHIDTYPGRSPSEPDLNSIDFEVVGNFALSPKLNNALNPDCRSCSNSYSMIMDINQIFPFLENSTFLIQEEREQGYMIWFDDEESNQDIILSSELLKREGYSVILPPKITSSLVGVLAIQFEGLNLFLLIIAILFILIFLLNFPLQVDNLIQILKPLWINSLLDSKFELKIKLGLILYFSALVLGILFVSTFLSISISLPIILFLTLLFNGFQTFLIYFDVFNSQFLIWILLFFFYTILVIFYKIVRIDIKKEIIIENNKEGL